MRREQQYCTFLLDGALFGLEIEAVQEILRHQDMTRVPLAPGAVAGLINLRGQIVPALDLRHCFALAERSSEAKPTNIVVQTEDGAVSLLTDDVGDILTLSDDAFEPPPDNMRGTTRALVRGVYKLADGLMLVLSVTDVIGVAAGASPGPQQLRERKDKR